MASFKTLQLNSIKVGDRARPVDEDHALAIAASMAERGLINPITVRSTPAAKNTADGSSTPYTLVAGAHRLRAAELNQWTKIDAIVVNADAAEAQLMEISENLFRNELSKLDRALFVMKYREIFEEQNGKINPKGGRPKKQSDDWTDIFSKEKGLSERVQNRLGIGRSAFFDVQKIGFMLHPTLRQAVRGTAAEDNQKVLLKLAKLPPEEQCKVAATLKYETDIDIVLKCTKPVPVKTDKQGELYAKVIDAWTRMNFETKQRVLEHIGMVDLMAEKKPDAPHRTH